MSEEKTQTASKPAERPSRPRGGDKKRYRRRVCRFCHNKDLAIDYKRVDVLVRCVSNKGKILPRRLTGTCAKHQRMVSKAIRKARMAGFMPFAVS